MTDGLEPLPASAWEEPRMRRRRALIGTGCAVMLLVMGACSGCFFVGRRAQSEGEAFLRQLSPRLMQPWAPAVLSENAAPGLTRGMTPGQLEKFVRFVADRLGSLTRIDAVHEGRFNVYAGTEGFQVRVQYVMEGTFEKGAATIQWVLLKQAGQWRVEGFRVNSDLLMQ